jgi:hypothetical protein
VRAFELAIRGYRNNLTAARDAGQEGLRAEIQRQIDAQEPRYRASIAESIAATREGLDRAIAGRRDFLVAVETYLRALQKSEADFDRWFARLKAAAGPLAQQILAPPEWPTPPDSRQLSELAKPLTITIAKPDLPLDSAANFNLTRPRIPPLPRLSSNFPTISFATRDIVIPSEVGWKERSNNLRPCRRERL